MDQISLRGVPIWYAAQYSKRFRFKPYHRQTGVQCTTFIPHYSAINSQVKSKSRKCFHRYWYSFQNCLQDSLFLKYWVVLKIKTDLQKMGIDFSFLLQNYRRWEMILCLALFSPWIQRKTLAISYWHSTVLEPSFWISL